MRTHELLTDAVLRAPSSSRGPAVSGLRSAAVTRGFRRAAATVITQRHSPLRLGRDLSWQFSSC